MHDIINDYNRYYRLKSMREVYAYEVKGVRDKIVRNKTLKEIERIDRELEDYDITSLTKVKEFIDKYDSVTEARKDIYNLDITSVRKVKEVKKLHR